jgi:hypothetical protein
MFWFQLIKLVTLALCVRLTIILNELGIISTFGNPTYTPTAHSKDEIIQNHRSVLDTFYIQVNEMDKDELPYLYWIPKLHKTLTNKDTAGSRKCSTNYPCSSPKH